MKNITKGGKLYIDFTSLLSAFLFLLFSRDISIYYINNNDILNQTYLFFSKTAAAAVMVLLLLNWSRIKKEVLEIVICIFLFLFFLLLSTILGNGDVQRCFMMAYPIIGMCSLVVLSCRTRKRLKSFVRGVSNLFYILVCANFLFLIYDVNFFENRFFLGIKNQLGYPVLLGFLFCYLDKTLNGTKWKFSSYVVFYFFSIFIIFSGSNVIGALIIATYLFVPRIKKIIQKVNFKTLLIVFLFALIFLCFPLNFNILELEIVQIFIVDFLGKNLTLSSRTLIWETAMIKVLERPILGYGVQSTMNLFYIKTNYIDRPNHAGFYSAHNQWVQTLYEGGFVGFVLILVSLLLLARMCDTSNLKSISGMIKISLFALLVMLLAESAAWNTMITMLVISAVTLTVLKEDMAERIL